MKLPYSSAELTLGTHSRSHSMAALLQLTTKLLVIVLVVCLAACQEATTIKVDETNPPTIHVSGTESVNWIWVYGPFPQGHETAKPPLIWKINHAGLMPKIENLPPITYGKVPSGFTQETPTEGEPPPLIEGGIYGIGVVTDGENHGYKRILINKGKVKELPEE